MITVYAIPDCLNCEFYHWFYYAIATLHEVADLSGVVYFTVPMHNLEFQNTTLDLIKHKFVCVNDGVPNPNHEEVVVQKLNYVRAHPVTNIPEQTGIYAFLRKTFLANSFPSVKPLSRLIYISRAKTKDRKRHILNEDAFIPTLIEKGFEIIYFEDYPLLEKIKIFLEAKILISASGGALSLGFLLNPNATVLELLVPNVFVWCNAFKPIFTELGLPIQQYTNLAAFDMNNLQIVHHNEYANILVKDIPEFLATVDSLVQK